MLYSFHCPPQATAEVGDLVFTWDDVAGTVAGPGASAVLALVRQGWVSYGPHPRASWPLGEGALRSRRDMAALIGHAWAVPPELLADYPELVTLPCYDWQHVLVTPADHALARQSQISLEDLAKLPLVTYHPTFSGRSRVDAAFARARLTPNIALEAIDADVIKTYVDVGLGIGIVAAMAYNAERDTNLVRIDVPELFQPNITRLAIRHGVYLRDYAYDFILRLVPGLNAERIAEALRNEVTGHEDFVI